MDETDAANDLRQIVAHLESLRRAGLTDLPRVAVVSPPLENSETNSVPVPVSEPRPRATAPLPSPVAKEQSGPAASNLIDEPRPSAPPPAAKPAGALPGMAETRPPAPKRASASVGAKRPAPPVASFFDMSRVPFESPVVPPDDRPELLRVLAEEVAACTRCPHLAATRTQTVFASGTSAARLMFIGEAPGADEDRLGEPFVGRAGQLLTDIVSKGMGLSRSDVYIANILKCRPPENRNPLPDEMAHCREYLDRQIEIVRPEFLCLLGKVAVGAILQTSVPMKTLRLRWHRYRDIPTIVTWHPAYLLRNPDAKKDTWEDIKMLMAEMGLKPPSKA